MTKPFQFRKRTPESKDRATYMMGIQRSLFSHLQSDYDPSDAASVGWALVKAARLGSKGHDDACRGLSTLDASQLGVLRDATRKTMASEVTKESPLKSELANDILCMLNGYMQRAKLATSSQPTSEPDMTPRSVPGGAGAGWPGLVRARVSSSGWVPEEAPSGVQDHLEVDPVTSARRARIAELRTAYEAAGMSVGDACTQALRDCGVGLSDEPMTSES